MTKRTWRVVVSVILALVLAAVTCVSIVCWPKNPGPELELGAPAEDGEGNEMLPEEVYPMPKEMVFRMSAADTESAESSSVQLTVEPSYTYEGLQVDWFVGWRIPNEKLGNATDYVTVTPTSDGALTATVTCLAEFGNPIEVSAKVRGDEEFSTATCTIGYKQRLKSLGLKLSKFDAADDIDLSVGIDASDNIIDMPRYDELMTGLYRFRSSDYTVRIGDVSFKLQVRLSTDFSAKLTAQGLTTQASTWKDVFTITRTSDIAPTTVDQVMMGTTENSSFASSQLFKVFCGDIFLEKADATTGLIVKTEEFKKYSSAARSVTGHHLELQAVATWDGGTISSEVYKVRLNPSSLPVEIVFDKDSIIF